MIRVFKAHAGESLTQARDGSPILTGVDANAVRVQLVSGSSFQLDEATAIERALVELKGRDDADVVIAPGGSLYRIFLGEEAAPRFAPAPAPPGPTPNGRAPAHAWLASDRTTRAIAVGKGSLAVRVSELLHFLGYDARSSIIEDGVASLLAELDEHQPEILLLCDPIETSLLESVLAAARARRCAVVALGDGPAENDVDARIPLPLASGRLAPILDPIVQRVRAARGRAEKI